MSKAHIGGKDINVPAPPKATCIRRRIEAIAYFVHIRSVTI